MKHRYFVSTYVTSPSMNDWDPEAEQAYFQALAQRPEVVGVEHPFSSHSKKYPLDWLQQHIPDHWSVIITTMPAFMGAARENPWLGLASVREQDRCAAVTLMEQVAAYVLQLKQVFGRKVVNTIHFHALPKNDETGMRGHKEALKRSLRDIKNIDFSGAHLNLEHCDAYVPGQPAEKGFLSLQDELELLSDAGGFGVVLNWARSAIEGRSRLTPLAHIRMTQTAGLLKGFCFSGCTDDPCSEYGAWKDSHVPPMRIIDSPYLCEESLLGAEEIQQVFSLLDEDIYLGVKVTDSSKQKSAQRSVGLNVDTIAALEAEGGVARAIVR